MSEHDNTPTPRTDFEATLSATGLWVTTSFAKNIERALATVTKERDNLAAWKQTALSVELWWKEVEEYVRKMPDARPGYHVSHLALGFLKERGYLRAENAALSSHITALKASYNAVDVKHRALVEENAALRAERDEALKRSDFYTERSVGAMHIAEGEEDHDRIPRDCPMLQAVSRLRQQFETEKSRRLYYQDIVYYACNLVNKAAENRPGSGVVCGTFETPSNELQEALFELYGDFLDLRSQLTMAIAEKNAMFSETQFGISVSQLVDERLDHVLPGETKLEAIRRWSLERVTALAERDEDAEECQLCKQLSEERDSALAACAANTAALRELVDRRSDQSGFYYVSKVIGGCGKELSERIESALSTTAGSDYVPKKILRDVCDGIKLLQEKDEASPLGMALAAAAPFLTDSTGEERK